jgi:nucleotide-binding universal stress UspA family protein
MEKVLVVINAQKPNLEAIHFACTIAAAAHTNLTGLFVENFYLNHIPSSVGEYPSYFDVVKEKKVNEVKADTEQAITIFKNECRRRGITPKTYVDKGEPIQEVIFESRFADLLVVDPAIGLYETEEQLPSHFVKEILATAECPVFLAPEEFESVDEIVFCYDGSASSVFAIKQFTYLLPEFRNKKVMLLEVNKTGEE